MTEETKLNCSVNHNYREGYQQGRADAIDEFVEYSKLKDFKFDNYGKSITENDVIEIINFYIFQIAEQLKEHNNEH